MFPSSSPAAAPIFNTAPTSPCISRPRTSTACFTTATKSRSAASSSQRTSPQATPKGPPHGPWTTVEAGRTLHVVIVGSPNVNPGYKLVGNKTYPQIAADYRHVNSRS